MSVIVHLNTTAGLQVLTYEGADNYNTSDLGNGEVVLNVYSPLAKGGSSLMQSPIATIRDWSAAGVVDDKLEGARMAAMAVHPSTWNRDQIERLDLARQQAALQSHDRI